MMTGPKRNQRMTFVSNFREVSALYPSQVSCLPVCSVCAVWRDMTLQARYFATTGTVNRFVADSFRNYCSLCVLCMRDWRFSNAFYLVRSEQLNDSHQATSVSSEQVLMLCFTCTVFDACAACAVAVKEKRRKHKPVVLPEQHDDEEGGSDSDGDQFAAAQVREFHLRASLCASVSQSCPAEREFSAVRTLDSNAIVLCIS